MKEAELKSAVEEYLQYGANQGKWVFLRLNSGDFIEVRGQTRRRIKGCPKGTADFLILKTALLWDGVHATRIPSVRVIFIELKSDKGKQTKEQGEFQGEVEAQGAQYHIIRTLEEIAEVLK